MYTNEELINYIKTIKPDYIESQNSMLYRDEVKKVFSKEELANIIISIDSKMHWDFYMNAFSYGRKDDRDIVILIAKKNPSFFNVLKDDMLFNFKTIIQEYENCYDIQEIKRPDFSTEIYSNELINYIITIKKLYKEHKLDKDELKYYYDLMTNLLIKKVANNKFYEDDIIIEVCGYILSNDVKISDFINNIDLSIEELFSIGKFKLNKFKGINVNTMRFVKKTYITNLLSILYSNNIKVSEEQEKGLIKMISILGYSNAENIIRYNHNILDILDNFYTIDLFNYDNIKKESFINLFMGKNINDPNSLLNTIYGEDFDIIKLNINYVFNCWDNIELRFQNQQIDSKTKFIKRLLSESKYLLKPDEYKLEGEIIEKCLDDRKFVHVSTDTLVNTLRSLYSNMKHNYIKSIPYVSGNYEKYHYETLLADDPKLFKMGSDTNCCFKLCGDATNFVEYCAVCPHGRVIHITDENNKTCAMIPILRNGNLILANSIESERFNDFSFMKKMFDILKLISDEFISISSKQESEKEHIMAVIIGNYKNQINRFLSLEKETELSFSTVSPLKDDLYFNGGGFDWTNYYISKRDDYNPSNVKRFESNTVYLDPRSEIIEIEYDELNEDIVKLINSISYEFDKEFIDVSNIQRIAFNKDWFVILTKDLNIIHKKVGNDPRAQLEYEERLNLYVIL